MVETHQSIESSVLGQSKIREARRLANTVTLNQLTSRLKKDPAADLSEALKQQVTLYPRLVTDLAKPASPRDSDGKAIASDVNDKQYSTKSLGIPADAPIELIHPLHRQVLAHAHIDQEDYSRGASSGHLPEGAVVALSQIINEGEVLHCLHRTFVLGIGPRQVVKISPDLDPDGITNLQYVSSHVPEIPTPRCLGALRSGQRTYVFMSRAPGMTLESVWPDLSISHKVSIRRQLNHIFRILRVPSPETPDGRMRMGSFLSGVCKDTRRSKRVSSDPVQTEEDFNDFLCREPGRTETPWIQMVRSFMKGDHRIVMTHGDLHPRNIMVTWETDQANMAKEKNIRVTAIIDWEAAGWYPEYWEFVKALNTIDVRGPLSDWVNYLPTEAIGSFPMEFSIDCLIGRWLG